MEIENKKLKKGIEKLLNVVSVGGFLAGSYIAITDFVQLKEISSEGLMCIVQDPRLLISAGIGASGYVVGKLYNYASNKPDNNLRDKKQMNLQNF